MRPRAARQEGYAQVYFEAALEHKAIAYELHEAGRYVMAHYVAGLAVDRILRAYRYRIDPVFDARHDLQTLHAASHLGDALSPDEQEELSGAITEVARRWSSNHRYRSERALRDYLRQAGLGPKGKFVRESSRHIVSAAMRLVDQGVLHWND